MRRLEDNLEIDVGTKKITAKYPWKPCVSRMRDNYHQALRIQTHIEAGMRKKGTLEGFREEVAKSAAEGTVR